MIQARAITFLSRAEQIGAFDPSRLSVRLLRREFGLLRGRDCAKAFKLGCERGTRHISVVSTEADSLPVREGAIFLSLLEKPRRTPLKAVEHAGRCRF